MSSQHSILIIDDQIGVEDSTHQRAFLRRHGSLPCEFHFSSANADNRFSVEAAYAPLAAGKAIDLVLLDLRFGDDDAHLGFDILREVRARFPELPVVIASALDRDVATLGRCLEEGALGFVEKSASPGHLKDAIDRALEISRSHVLVGQSPPIRELRRQAARLSPYDQIPVLIIGERGTGKELVARNIHVHGPRRQGLFLAVNCAAIPENLIDAELFGAEKGAYTGATSRRIGYFERAHGGLLFLDEIGDMPLPTQAKLLRVLQDGTYRRIGSSSAELETDFQLVCATNVDPAELVAKGRLREDLYDRIAAVNVRTPPLRQCQTDTPELVAHFVRQLGLEGSKRFSAAVMDLLQSFDWPGNVRQLQRAVQEAVVRSEDNEEIEEGHLPDFLRNSASSRSSLQERARGEAELPDDPSEWPERRLLGEIRLALEVKRHVQAYKGSQWKAEFMRLMYPHCKAQNAKGFCDLIRRLTKGPWGDPDFQRNPEVKRLLDELRR